jgi:hypothetical protein
MVGVGERERKEGKLAQNSFGTWEKRPLPQDVLFFLRLLAPFHPHFFQSDL